MNKRVRLTERMRRRRRAVEDDTPYPGTVNQPDRQFKRMDQYDDWEMEVNHPYPDMRHEWQDNPRDEIGFGTPSRELVASIRTAASKSVRLAILLLGDKVPQKHIEAQARDFMKLGNKGLDRALRRFAETENLFVAEEEAEEAEEEAEEAEEEAEEAEEEAEEAEEADATASRRQVMAEAQREADWFYAGDEADDEEEEDDEADEGAEEEPDSKTSSEEFEVELDSIDDELGADLIDDGFDDEILPDPNDSVLAAALFGDDEVPEDIDAVLSGDSDIFEGERDGKKASSGKRGIKSLGGQPRVASEQGAGADDISGVWDTLDAPDYEDLWE